MGKRKYVYHMAYNFVTNDKGYGFGSCCHTRDNPLDTEDKIAEWVKQIVQNQGWKSAVLINFIRIKSET